MYVCIYLTYAKLKQTLLRVKELHLVQAQMTVSIVNY